MGRAGGRAHREGLLLEPALVQNLLEPSEEEEEEEEEEEDAQVLFLPILFRCAATAMWARVPLSLVVVWWLWTSLCTCTTSSSSRRSTVEGASFHFSDKVVDIPVVLRRQVRLFTGAVLGQGCFPARYCTTANPHGPACSEYDRGSAVAVCQVVDAPVVQVVPCPLSF